MLGVEALLLRSRLYFLDVKGSKRLPVFFFSYSKINLIFSLLVIDTLKLFKITEHLSKLSLFLHWHARHDVLFLNSVHNLISNLNKFCHRIRDPRTKEIRCPQFSSSLQTLLQETLLQKSWAELANSKQCYPYYQIYLKNIITTIITQKFRSFLKLCPRIAGTTYFFSRNSKILSYIGCIVPFSSRRLATWWSIEGIYRCPKKRLC